MWHGAKWRVHGVLVCGDVVVVSDGGAVVDDARGCNTQSPHVVAATCTHRLNCVHCKLMVVVVAFVVVLLVLVM